METVAEFWYLKSIALVIPVAGLIALAYVLYDSRQQKIEATMWLVLAVLSIALALPAAWTAANLQPQDKEVLQQYLEDRAAFVEQFGEDTARAIETIASNLGITEEIGLDYHELELYLYLSLAGLAVSVITIIGYLQAGRKSAGATQYLPPTQQQFPQGQGYASGTYAPVQNVGPSLGGGYVGTQPDVSGGMMGMSGLGMGGVPTAMPPSMAGGGGGHPPTEHLQRGGTPYGGYGSQYGPGGGSGPARTELLNAPSTAVNAFLVMKDGNRAGKLYHLSPESTTIGRDPGCDITLDDSTISRHHAKVRQIKTQGGPDQFIIHDLASSSGTKLNGADVTKEALKDGDEILLGRTTLVFKQVA
jgi:hypothetical protein